MAGCNLILFVTQAQLDGLIWTDQLDGPAGVSVLLAVAGQVVRHRSFAASQDEQNEPVGIMIGIWSAPEVSTSSRSDVSRQIFVPVSLLDASFNFLSCSQEPIKSRFFWQVVAVERSTRFEEGSRRRRRIKNITCNSVESTKSRGTKLLNLEPGQLA